MGSGNYHTITVSQNRICPAEPLQTFCNLADLFLAVGSGIVGVWFEIGHRNSIYLPPFLTITPIMFVVNSDVAEANKTADDPWAQDYLANNAAGAGAYLLDSWERGATMTMKRFGGYHLGWDDQSVDEVRFVVTNEEATVKALAA